MTTGTTTTYDQLGPDRSATLLAQTMGLVALTAGFFAASAYLARDFAPAWGWVFLVSALVATIGLNAAVQHSEAAAVAALCALGIFLGGALAPLLFHYAGADPQALALSAAATGLFISGFGAAGYATRRDLSELARTLFWALVGLIVFGVVLVFVQIPGGGLVYAVLGLVIFGGLTSFDFQRLRRSEDIRSAPILAASIFLDIVNVFSLFSSLFGSADN